MKAYKVLISQSRQWKSASVTKTKRIKKTQELAYFQFNRKKDPVAFFFLPILSFNVILIFPEEGCVFPPLALTPPFHSHLHGQKRSMHRTHFSISVPGSPH